MKKIIKDAIEAFPTSKKHLIGFVIAIICSISLIYFNFLGWNELEYNDTYFIIGDVYLPPYFGQTIITLIIGWCVNFGVWEFYQQKNIPINKRPSTKDTIWDSNYMAISAWIGMTLTTILI